MTFNPQTDSENTIIGAFNKYADAERAMRDLKEAGIPADRIGIGADQNGNNASSADGTQHEGFWRKIADFFEGKDHSVDASGHNQELEAGSHVVVTVLALTLAQRQECAEILKEHDATLESNPMKKSVGNQADGREGGQRIQLLSEVLRVDKERVSKGEVRLRKEVVTENKTVQVPITHEELVIDRMPVASGTPASGAIGSNQEIRVPLSEEKVRIEKKPMVKEEVRVGKKNVQESRQVNEQVKREELHVDRQDESSTQQPPTKKIVA